MMTSTTAAQAFADAASRMVSRSDIAGDLVLLLIDCADLLSAQAVGLLVAVPDNGLELLSSSAHQARELEVYELQNGTGPCIDAIRFGEHVTAISPELDTAWAPLGAQIVAHGFRSVHAFPLTWHGTAIGALNVFHADAVVLDDGDRLLAGTFADLATAVLARPLETGVTALRQQIMAALDGRIVIEQGKGVIAYRENLEMSDAFSRLLQLAAASGRTLSQVAGDILTSVSRSS
jgi:GAF domain-containing protein